MGADVVVVDQVSRLPEFWSFAANVLSELGQNFPVHLPIDGGSFGHEFNMNQSFVVEKGGHHCLAHGPGHSAFVWVWCSGWQPLGTALL